MKQSFTLTEKLGVIWMYIYRSAKLWIRFKVSFLFSFIALFISVAIFYYMYLFIGDVPGYGSYFTFVLVGMAVNQYIVSLTVNAYLGAMHKVYWSNWLEILLTSPTKTKTFFVAVMSWSYLISTMNMVLYFLVGILVFGASFAFSSATWVVLPILLLLIISLSGIGLISASMFMLANAKGDIEPISWGIGVLSGLLTGVYFPPEYLPLSIQMISKILPQTYAIDAIRRILIYGEGISSPSIQWTLFYLVLFSVIIFPFGMWMFNRGIKKAERDGTLARWS
ncbi:MAG: ABC transporter permease [Euryarchaeota archaeon]|nr:ABC transporter permease [Euryarchaeota archaeon]